jgi:hypothetical protein
MQKLSVDVSSTTQGGANMRRVMSNAVARLPETNFRIATCYAVIRGVRRSANARAATCSVYHVLCSLIFNVASPEITRTSPSGFSLCVIKPGHGGLIMHSLLRMICAAAAVGTACSPAGAAEKTMPIDFVGDWCFSSLEGTTTEYKLPSWIEDGHCTKILSINQYGFYGEGRSCEPVNLRLSKNTAPSGTAYTAVVTARCQKDGPVTAGVLQTFEFLRYKGTLTVTTK